MNTNEFNLLTLAEAIETISSQTDLLEKEASSLKKNLAIPLLICEKSSPTIKMRK